MLAIERRNAILSKLYLDGKVIVSALSQEFDVTEETIRRDLEKLDKEGLVKTIVPICLIVSEKKQTLKQNKK